MIRRLPTVLVCLAAAVVLAGCTTTTTTGSLSPATATQAPTPSPAASQWPAGWTIPDHALTPGALATGYTQAGICPHVNPKLEAGRPSQAEAQQVYERYGITTRQPGQYEVDHLVPIELLGAPDSPQNLWPEPNDTPDPAMVKAEHLSPGFVHNSKDLVEDVLHRDVCSGQVPLSVAQQAIASDWRQAYVKYVGLVP